MRLRISALFLSIALSTVAASAQSNQTFTGTVSDAMCGAHHMMQERLLHNVPANASKCHREQRYVGAQLTLNYGRRQIILDRSELSEDLAGKYVKVYDFSDRMLEVRWKGHSLPYRVFDKEQRVNQSAIVENKRLGHALAIVKAQQDRKHETKVMTNSEKLGYKKTPRRVYGPGFEPKTRLAGSGGNAGLMGSMER